MLPPALKKPWKSRQRGRAYCHQFFMKNQTYSAVRPANIPSRRSGLLYRISYGFFIHTPTGPPIARATAPDPVKLGF